LSSAAVISYATFTARNIACSVRLSPTFVTFRGLVGYWLCCLYQPWQLPKRIFSQNLKYL